MLKWFEVVGTCQTALPFGTALLQPYHFCVPTHKHPPPKKLYCNRIFALGLTSGQINVLSVNYWPNTAAPSCTSLSFFYCAEIKLKQIISCILFEPICPQVTLRSSSYPQSAVENLNLSFHVMLLVLQLLHRVWIRRWIHIGGINANRPQNRQTQHHTYLTTIT